MIKLLNLKNKRTPKSKLMVKQQHFENPEKLVLNIDMSEMPKEDIDGAQSLQSSFYLTHFPKPNRPGTA